MKKQKIEVPVETEIITDEKELESIIRQYKEAIIIAEDAISSLRKSVLKVEDKIRKIKEEGKYEQVVYPKKK